jgi:hypothetical protein
VSLAADKKKEISIRNKKANSSKKKMESEMDLQLMLLPAVVDPLANNNNNNINNKMVVVNCRDEEAEYLERLLTEKKIVDSTAGLDWTQKLINAGKRKSPIHPSIYPSSSCSLQGSI